MLSLFCLATTYSFHDNGPTFIQQRRSTGMAVLPRRRNDRRDPPADVSHSRCCHLACGHQFPGTDWLRGRMGIPLRRTAGPEEPWRRDRFLTIAFSPAGLFGRGSRARPCCDFLVRIPFFGGLARAYSPIANPIPVPAADAGQNIIWLHSSLPCATHIPKRLAWQSAESS